MKSPFRPREYGADVLVLHQVFDETSEDVYKAVENRIIRNANAVDTAMARRRGRFRFWFPRGLRWNTFRMEHYNTTEGVLFEWRAYSR